MAAAVVQLRRHAAAVVRQPYKADMHHFGGRLIILIQKAFVISGKPLSLPAKGNES
jgi:hypothetical protein